MFHNYVLASSGTVVDFDRASFLMNRDLLQEAIDAMRHERATCPRLRTSLTPESMASYPARISNVSGFFELPQINALTAKVPEGSVTGACGFSFA